MKIDLSWKRNIFAFIGFILLFSIIAFLNFFDSYNSSSVGQNNNNSYQSFEDVEIAESTATREQNNECLQYRVQIQDYLREDVFISHENFYQLEEVFYSPKAETCMFIAGGRYVEYEDGVQTENFTIKFLQEYHSRERIVVARSFDAPMLAEFERIVNEYR